MRRAEAEGAAAPVSRLPFLAAAALIAAAVGNALVESLSNRGVFGGRYADDDHLSVVPALVLGAMLLAALAALRCLEIFRGAPRNSPNRLIRVARGLSGRTTAQDFPSVYAMQLGALFLMESFEQIAAGGKLLGGAAWLGGPAVASLATHALIGAACLIALRRFMQAVVTAFATLVAAVAAFILIARGCAAGAFLGRPGKPARATQSPRGFRLGGRAPPVPLTPA